MKIRITAITEWCEDEWLIDGDASHEGYRAVERLLEDERHEKLDKDWTKGLPFTCTAKDIDSALGKYNNKHLDCDYLKAAEADWEEVEEG